MEKLIEFINKVNNEKYQPDKNEFDEFRFVFINSLNEGKIRSAYKDTSGEWKTNLWVKQGILLLFRMGEISDYSINPDFKFFDKHTLPLRPFDITDGIRIVPGGSSIRTGCYVAKGVICMPPMYINIGSYVDEGSLIDSHALVGTCAQVGKRVHVSAAAQIGGVLEPAGARPVIIEDDVLVGGNCGIYEGTLVRKRAVLGSGTIITSSTKIYDLINEKVIKSENGMPVEVPESAVIVPGARAIITPFGIKNNLSIYSPMIIKYRDDKTDAKTALEDALR